MAKDGPLVTKEMLPKRFQNIDKPWRNERLLELIGEHWADLCTPAGEYDVTQEECPWQCEHCQAGYCAHCSKSITPLRFCSLSCQGRHHLMVEADARRSSPRLSDRAARVLDDLRCRQNHGNEDLRFATCVQIQASIDMRDLCTFLRPRKHVYTIEQIADALRELHAAGRIAARWRNGGPESFDARFLRSCGVRMQ